jgi:hypothetical protein
MPVSPVTHCRWRYGAGDPGKEWFLILTVGFNMRVMSSDGFWKPTAFWGAWAEKVTVGITALLRASSGSWSLRGSTGGTTRRVRRLVPMSCNTSRCGTTALDCIRTWTIWVRTNLKDRANWPKRLNQVSDIPCPRQTYVVWKFQQRTLKHHLRLRDKRICLR